MANPLLNSEAARQRVEFGADVATANGAASKIFMLLTVVLLAAVASASGAVPLSMPVVIVCAIVAVAIAFGVSFAPQYAAPLSLIYAVAEGLMLGGISAIYAAKFHGIILQAVLATFGVAFACMVLYSTGAIKVNDKFMSVLKVAMFSLMFVYLAEFIMGFFGVRIPYIHSSGIIGIGFSLIVIVIAAMSLLADFAFVDQSIRSGSPKYMEWFCAFSILVTLIWMYVEILDLLRKLNTDED